MDYSEGIKKLLEGGDSDGAIELCRTAVRRHEEDGDWEALAKQLHNLGGLLDWYESDYPGCIEAYTREVEVRELRGLEGLDGAHLGLGMIHNFLACEEAAMRELETALSLAASDDTRATALNILGDIFLRKDQERSGAYLGEAERIFEGLGDAYMLCHARLSVSLLRAYRGDRAGAEVACAALVDRAKAMGEDGLVGTAYLRMAEILALEGKEGESGACSARALEIAERKGWAVMKREAEEIRRMAAGSNPSQGA